MIRKFIKLTLIKAVTLIDKFRLRNNTFVIVSNNCWGAKIYQNIEREYNTPFVGLFLYGPCYIQLLENFEQYTNLKLQFTKTSTYFKEVKDYPIGLLNDVEIHFLHYKSEDEAMAKWERRLEKMKKVTDYNKYYFKICDSDKTDAPIINRFHQLTFKNKISFSINAMKISNSTHIYIDETNNNNTHVPNGVILYRYTYKYIDLVHWINTRSLKSNLYSKFKTFANII